MDPAKLAKLQAQAAANRIGQSFPIYLIPKSHLSDLPGGKGTVRRKVVRRAKPSAAQDDKKLQGALKKLNVQPIPGVEEVNMFREDGNVLHFSAPKGTHDQLISAIILSDSGFPSSCRCLREHIRCLRRWSSEGVDRTRPWYP